MNSAPLAILALGALHLLAAVVLLLAFSLIGFVLMPERIRPSTARISIPLSLSVGSAAVGLTGWVVGTLLGTGWIFAAFGALLLAGLLSARPWWTSARRVFVELFCLMKYQRTASVLLAVSLLALIPHLLLPVIDSDGLRYHLALPKLFLLTGKIFYYRWDVTGAFPQTAEVLYLIAMRLGGAGEVAKFLHAGFFVCNLGVLMLIVHTGRARRRAALAAPLLFAISPVVFGPAAAAFIDHIALYHIAVASLVLTGRRGTRVSGVPLGAAFATKLTTGPAVAALSIAAMAGGEWKGRRLHGLVAVLMPVVLLFGPFALRNLWFTGDPIFPVGLGILGGDIAGLRPGALNYASEFHGAMRGLVGIPWTPSESVPADEVVGLHHLLGLFSLVLAIRRPRFRSLFAVVVAYLLLSFVYRPPARYLLPMIFCLSAFEGVAIELVARRWTALVTGIVVLPAAVWILTVMLPFGDPLSYLAGRVTRAQVLEHVVPGWTVARTVNSLPAGGTVMAIDFPAPFYFDRPWIAEGILNETPIELWMDEGKSAGQILDQLRRRSVRYIVVTPGVGGGGRISLLPLARSREEAETILQLRNRLRLVGSVSGSGIYEVPPAPNAGG